MDGLRHGLEPSFGDRVWVSERRMLYDALTLALSGVILFAGVRAFYAVLAAIGAHAAQKVQAERGKRRE